VHVTRRRRVRTDDCVRARLGVRTFASVNERRRRTREESVVRRI
jgi:hypothetical protein